MEMRQLRYFIGIAEDLNFTRAAKRLRVAQPALSQQIKALEIEIGTLLFRREPRGVKLTESGTHFLAKARSLIEDLDHAVLETRRIGQGRLGAIRIGFTSSASFNPLVTNSIRDFRAAFPDVEVDLIEEPTRTLLTLLAAGQIDVTFLRENPGLSENLWVHRLLSEPMVIALSSNHALALEPTINLRQLAGEDFILFRRRFGVEFYDAIIEACELAGFQPAIAFSPPHLTSTLSLVASGMGIAIVPQSMAGLMISGVAFRSISSAVPKANLTLARTMKEPLATAVLFTDFVKSYTLRST